MNARALSRSDRSALGNWFWTIDHVLLALVLVLIGIGLIAVAAASPAAAHRFSGGAVHVAPLHFFWRQLMWVAVGLPVMVATSLLTPTQVRRIGMIGTPIGAGLLLLVLAIGTSVHGGQRWLALGPVQLQPSEFLKPLFIVATASLLALRFEDERLPALTMSFATLVCVVALLVAQPDMGQTILFCAVWLVMAFLAGMRPMVAGIAAGAGAAGLGVAYALGGHVRTRIDGFIKGTGDHYQVQNALDCFRAGGLFGVGPGQGVMKMRLPEPHTDYIFSVIGEEFGAIACITIALLFAAVVVRALSRLTDEDDPFVLLAAAGLTTQFGLQAAINMGVNLHLLPSKGMTLPFISHGGSSFVALCAGMGLLLALLRRNPYAKASPYKWAKA